MLARFADGSTARGDLLIGADGLRSATRRIIDPNAPRPRYVPLLNTGGYARGVSPPGEPGVLHMFFGRRCFFSYVTRPDGEVWWFANPPQPRELEPRELAAITPQRWRARLRPDVPRAFAAYETLRRGRVERVVAQGKHNGSGKAAGRLGRLLLPLVFRFVARSAGRQGWLYDHRIEWHEPVSAA